MSFEKKDNSCQELETFSPLENIAIDILRIIASFLSGSDLRNFMFSSHILYEALASQNIMTLWPFGIDKIEATHDETLFWSQGKKLTLESNNNKQTFKRQVINVLLSTHSTDYPPLFWDESGQLYYMTVRTQDQLLAIRTAPYPEPIFHTIPKSKRILHPIKQFNNVKKIQLYYPPRNIYNYGYKHAYLLSNDGTFHCFSYVHLKYDDTFVIKEVHRCLENKKIKDFIANQEICLIITEDNKLFYFGNNPESSHYTPRLIMEDKPIKCIIPGNNRTTSPYYYFIDTNGMAYLATINSNTAIINSINNTNNKPIKDVISMTSHQQTTHIFFLTKYGQVYMGAENGYSFTVCTILNDYLIKSITLAKHGNYFLTYDRKLLFIPNDRYKLIKILENKTIKSVSSKNHIIFILTDDGQVYYSKNNEEFRVVDSDEFIVSLSPIKEITNTTNHRNKNRYGYVKNKYGNVFFLTEIVYTHKAPFRFEPIAPSADYFDCALGKKQNFGCSLDEKQNFVYALDEKHQNEISTLLEYLEKQSFTEVSKLITEFFKHSIPSDLIHTLGIGKSIEDALNDKSIMTTSLLELQYSRCLGIIRQIIFELPPSTFAQLCDPNNPNSWHFLTRLKALYNPKVHAHLLGLVRSNIKNSENKIAENNDLKVENPNSTDINMLKQEIDRLEHPKFLEKLLVFLCLMKSADKKIIALKSLIYILENPNENNKPDNSVRELCTHRNRFSSLFSNEPSKTRLILTELNTKFSPE